MTNDKAWLDVLLVVQEDEFFALSKHGTIWGTVYFQIGENQFFPGQGWTDLVAAFVEPFAIDISMPEKGFVNLSFARYEKSVISKTVEIKHLLAHGQSIARELLSQCQKRQWSTPDTETLDRILKLTRY
jgi:hypothetical protein